MNRNVFNNVCNILREDAHWGKLNSVNNNWQQDPVFFNYHKLGNKQKGTNGEYVVSKLMEAMGHKVVAPEGTGHDRIVDDIKTEIKFSLAVSEKDMIVKDKFIINHVSKEKDWDRLVFCGVNPNPEWGNMKIRRNDSLPFQRQRMYFMHKDDFVSYMESPGSKIFKHQQGGEGIANDDFICTNFHELIELPFVKHISEW
tara:strand:- start:33 stop:629 length:597 start_codon:yes stop_codon:yes gene_type:complete